MNIIIKKIPFIVILLMFQCIFEKPDFLDYLDFLHYKSRYKNDL